MNTVNNKNTRVGFGIVKYRNSFPNDIQIGQTIPLKVVCDSPKILCTLHFVKGMSQNAVEYCDLKVLRVSRAKTKSGRFAFLLSLRVEKFGGDPFGSAYAFLMVKDTFSKKVLWFSNFFRVVENVEVSIIQRREEITSSPLGKLGKRKRKNNGNEVKEHPKKKQKLE